MWRWMGVFGTAILLLAVSWWPTSSYHGINYKVYEHRLPLAIKVMDFLSRNWHMRAMADRIVRPTMDARERTSAIFRWTVENIRLAPKGLPAVDDHVYHIMIRGYGNDDQLADVFATICVYAGVPALTTRLSIAGGEKPFITIALARVEGTWRVADPARRQLFVRPDSSLATVDDLRMHPEKYLSGTDDLRVGGVPYPRYFRSLRAPEKPVFFRARLQMPRPRLLYEIKRAFGINPVP